MRGEVSEDSGSSRDIIAPSPVPSPAFGTVTEETVSMGGPRINEALSVAVEKRERSIASGDMSIGHSARC
jgi:hypothetical protein